MTTKPMTGHVWASIEYPNSTRRHTINAVIESHSYGLGDTLRYRVRDHETGGVYIVAASNVKRQS